MSNGPFPAISATSTSAGPSGSPLEQVVKIPHIDLTGAIDTDLIKAMPLLE
jgi:hypothetical protein